MELNEYSFRKGDLFLFCGYRDHDYKLFKLLTKRFNMILINSPEMLTKELVDNLKPKMLFFPNWSWKVLKEIVDNYICVCCHEGDLPAGRGGSPIQNHIIRDIKVVNHTAYIMNDRIDTGPILCKTPLSLEGSLSDIFERTIIANYQLICKIIDENPRPVEQDESKQVTYKRRKPKDSQLPSLSQSLKYLYNFIRMLDDPYPNAHLIIDGKRINFKNPFLIDQKLSVSCEIIELTEDFGAL